MSPPLLLPDTAAASHTSTLCSSLGVEAKLDEINKLKVKGLVLGPLHTVQADQPNTLDLQAIDPTQGTEEALVAVLEKAHKKGRPFVLGCKSSNGSVFKESPMLEDILNE